MPRLAILILLLAGICAPWSAPAAQSYDNCTGFIDSLPATIGAQGVWCLRKDLSTANTSGDAITINANNVIIDCNDFKIGGLAAGNISQTIGIHAVNRQNATVRHCNVRGFHHGIHFHDGAGHLVEDNRLDNNLYVGIFVSGDNNRVRRNAVYDTGGAVGGVSHSPVGILAYANIVDNDVQGVFSSVTPSWPVGIHAYGAVVSDNRVAGVEPNVSNGSGYAMGIFGFSNLTSAVRNQVLASAGQSAGTGIRSMQFCVGNTVGNFATPYGACGWSTGNLP
jgi:parallel beta-helix repeat protein